MQILALSASRNRHSKTIQAMNGILKVVAEADGMVSIRDVVSIQLEKSKAEARFLNVYISGGYQYGISP